MNNNNLYNSCNESLFWRIFRNIVLFNKIFSNFNKYYYKGYHDITNVKTLFQQKHINPIEIIIDKIKCNNNIINSIKDIDYIISKLNSDKIENRSFFNMLFTSMSYIKFDKNKEEMIKIMINHSNIIALDEFIKIFNIENHKIKELLKKPKFKNDNFREIDSIKTIKMNYYLKSTININLINPKLLLSFQTTKIKTIIKLQKIIVSEFYKSDNFKNIQINEIHKLDKLILELDQINIKNQEILKLNFEQILQSEFYTIREIIHKYFKSIYKIYKLYNNQNNQNNNDKFKKPILYYIYFKNDLKIMDNKILKLTKIKGHISNYIEQIIKVGFYNNNKKGMNEVIIDLINRIFNFFNDKNNFNYSYQRSKTILSLCKCIISSNNIQVLDYLLKLVLFSDYDDKTFSGNEGLNTIISIYGHLIDSKELIDYFFKMKSDNIIFNNERHSLLALKYKHESILEHLEYLLQSNGRNLIFCLNDRSTLYNSFIWGFYRAFIQKPSIYTIQITKYRTSYIGFFESIQDFKQSDEKAVISILSNIQFKESLEPFSFQSLLGLKHYSKDKEVYKKIEILKNFIKFLFNNISKEYIELKIKKDMIEQQQPLAISSNFEFSTVLISSDDVELNIKSTSSSSSSLPNIDNTILDKIDFTIEKPLKPFKFKISLTYLIYCLYYIDRFDDIIYIINSIPQLLSFNLFNYLYKTCSTYYLELLINNFINNLENKDTINQLYQCLLKAAKKGYIQLFRNLITSNNHDYLFKIKETTPSSSLFESNLLLNLVKKSINSNNLNLSHLLIKSINFSKKDNNSLKSMLIKNKYNLN